MSSGSKSMMSTPTSKKPRSVGGRRKKFTEASRKLAGLAAADPEEASKTQKKVVNVRRAASVTKSRFVQPPTDDEASVDKRKDEPSRGNSTKEQSSTTNTPKKKGDNTLRGGKAIPKETISVVDEYVANCGYQLLHAAHESLAKQTPDPKEYQKFSQNKERNRSEQIPCLDKTRFILEPKEDEKESNDYIHANKVVIEGADREYIVTQAPLKNTFEDFWRMVFQAQSSTIVVIEASYEENNKDEQFWPTEAGEYKNHGIMFINNKKTETTSNGCIYTIEVLPEGCSNSLVTKIYYFSSWGANAIPSSQRHVLRFIKSVRTENMNPVTVVSGDGTGRACAYVLIEAVTTRIFKGVPTKFADVAMAIRSQRALAFPGVLVFLAAAKTIFDYIQVKVPKHKDAYIAFNHAIYANDVTPADQQ